jgi:hypothetical protein
VVMSFESRWSGWKVPLVSILIWHFLVILGAIRNQADFKNGIGNWYMIAVMFLVGGILIFYSLAELRRLR